MKHKVKITEVPEQNRRKSIAVSLHFSGNKIITLLLSAEIKGEIVRE